MRLTHDRHDQSLVVEVHGDAKVHVVVHHELAITDGRVHVRELRDGVDDGPGDERQVRQLRRPPRPLDPLEVDLHGDERVRGDLQRPEQVLAGEALDSIEGHDLARRGRFEQCEHVVTGDTPVSSGPGDRVRLQVMLGGKPPHGR